MLKFIIGDLLKPIFRRLSSNAAVFLSTLGVASGDIEVLTSAFVIAGGVAVDLVLSNLDKR